MVTALDKNTALVLIDLQNGIVQLPVVHPAQQVLKNTAKLLAAFRRAALPVVIVTLNPAGAPQKELRADAQPLKGMQFKPNWLELVPEIKTEDGDIFITKHTWSAFYEPALDNELKKRGITGIILAGIATSIGVEGTARGARERNYNITFASDAMTDMVAEAHENSLKNIFPRIGEIGTVDEIIEKL